MLARRYLALSDRVVEALTDPRRQRSALAALLLGFVALWTIYGALGHAFRDVHFDVGEALGWWRHDAERYHPPVGTWIVGAWFSVFPQLDVLVYLLAATVVGTTLLIAWMLFGDWLDRDKRVFALAMLSVLPFFSFLGSKPNANLIQMPFWAAASFFFLRSFVRRGAGPSALTAISIAGALLTKFWSVYLVAGMAMAAIIDRRRLRYLASPAPWIAVGIAAVLLLPYALSLASTPNAVVRVSGTMTKQTSGEALLRSAQYLAGAALYVTPALLLLTLLRPSRRALADVAMPASQDGRMIALLFWIPLALPALANAVFPHRLTALWTYPNWTLLPVVLLGSSLVMVTRRMASYAMAIAMLLPAIAVLIAPAIAPLTSCGRIAMQNCTIVQLPEPSRPLGGIARLVPCGSSGAIQFSSKGQHSISKPRRRTFRRKCRSGGTGP